MKEESAPCGICGKSPSFIARGAILAEYPCRACCALIGQPLIPVSAEKVGQVFVIWAYFLAHVGIIYLFAIAITISVGHIC